MGGRWNIEKGKSPYKPHMPVYANGYKQTVLKTDEPKGLWVRILPLAFRQYYIVYWMRMDCHTKNDYGIDLRVRIVTYLS